VCIGRDTGCAKETVLPAQPHSQLGAIFKSLTVDRPSKWRVGILLITTGFSFRYNNKLSSKLISDKGQPGPRDLYAAIIDRIQQLSRRSRYRGNKPALFSKAAARKTSSRELKFSNLCLGDHVSVRQSTAVNWSASSLDDMGSKIAKSQSQLS
jgi:hypothetical protein